MSEYEFVTKDETNTVFETIPKDLSAESQYLLAASRYSDLLGKALAERDAYRAYAITKEAWSLHDTYGHEWEDAHEKAPSYVDTEARRLLIERQRELSGKKDTPTEGRTKGGESDGNV